jgi:lipoprotein
MKNLILKYSVLTMVVFAFTGCLYQQPTAPTHPMPEPTRLEKKNITLKSPTDDISLENGVIKFKNGKRLFDDETTGIYATFFIKDQLFYVTQLQNGIKIKNINKETIWEKEASGIIPSKYRDNLMLYVYDGANGIDVYKFDGQKVTLIDRGLDMPKGKIYGIYVLDVSSEEALEIISFGGPASRHITNITVTNILDGSKITYNDFYKFLNSYCIRCTRALGIAGDNLILTYDEGYQKAIASFNLQTKTGDILYLETPDNKDILQILKNEEDVVLKIFARQAGEIKEINGVREYGTALAPKRIIHLNTLTEVADVSNGFAPVSRDSGYEGMGGYVTVKNITYELQTIMRKTVKPMF